MFDFDPFDPASFANPYPAYEVLRRDHPAYKRDNASPRVWPHYWMLSRAKDVNAALSDWKTFSSAQGTLIDTDISLLPPNMFNMDPPRHDELRSILARVLTASRIAGLEPRIRAAAERLIEEARAKGGFDVATDFAQKIPTITMCALMDLPEADQAKFLKWNLDTLAGGDFTSPEALAAYGEMGQYWEGLVEERTAHRGDDLISEILHSEVKGEELSTEEVAGFCSLLHDAAQNTTMNMIAHAALGLGRHPDARATLAAEPERWPTATEELLRFVSPVQGLARNTTRDVDIDGTIIPAGDQVLLLYGSANHDPDEYRDPDVLDLDRKVTYHWTFGHGIHYCLGNAVARLEVSVALRTLTELIGDWEVDEAGVTYNQLVPTRGVARGPITFTTR